ncbi:MAG TPA: hypothetical protein VIM34_24360 [Burkholderiaceae bacterium]
MTIGTWSPVPAAPAGTPASRSGGLEHAASNPRIAAINPYRAGRRSTQRRAYDMWAILLEAFGAMLLLIVIVWWTMFHGRRKGERDVDS